MNFNEFFVVAWARLKVLDRVDHQEWDEEVGDPDSRIKREAHPVSAVRSRRAPR